MRVDVVAGVDLGGTHIRVGMFEPSGQVVEIREERLPVKRTPDSGVEAVVGLIEQLLSVHSNTRLTGIGAGATGPVKPDEGTMISPHTDPPWQFVPFCAPLREKFQAPVVLENDADTAALGEYWQGAGQGIHNLYVVTVGTGIGTAFIRNGEIFRGMDGSHPEGGHQIIDPTSDRVCYCGFAGCWEILASGEAFTLSARKLARQHPDWIKILGVDREEQITSARVIEAARAGDKLAAMLVRQEGYTLGVGILNLISFFVPDMVILSGGMMHHFDLFEPEIRAVVQRHRILVPASDVTIRPDSLKMHAGVYGAGYAILQHLQSHSA